jgi:hypothetical protein
MYTALIDKNMRRTQGVVFGDRSGDLVTVGGQGDERTSPVEENPQECALPMRYR